MDERRFDVKRDGLGILLIALGLFPAALIVYALIKSSSADTGPVARAWIRFMGVVPSLVLTGGILFLGTRLFLFDRGHGLARHVAGFAGLALALSIALGAFSTTAGGTIGDATGGLVSATVHPAAGGLFGLIAIGLALWFPWLRGRVPARTSASLDAPPQPLEHEEDAGVSAEEAAALIPDEDFHRVVDGGRKQSTVTAVRSAPPPSPYPEDVRLKGQIPAGARPLTPPTDARTPSESAAQPSSVYRWTAGRTNVPVDGAGEDLAGTDAPEVVFDAEAVGDGTPIREYELPRDSERELTNEGEPARELDEQDDLALARETRGSALAIEGTASELIAADDRSAVNEPNALEVGRGVDRGATAEPSIALPRPSWEQSNLFTGEVDDLPVDAYGTPLTLVEALRRARGADASGPDAAENVPAETEFAAELEAGVEDGTELGDMRASSEGELGAVLAVEHDADEVDEDLEFEAIGDAAGGEDDDDVEFEDDENVANDEHDAALEVHEDALVTDLAPHEISADSDDEDEPDADDAEDDDEGSEDDDDDEEDGDDEDEDEDDDAADEEDDDDDDLDDAELDRRADAAQLPAIDERELELEPAMEKSEASSRGKSAAPVASEGPLVELMEQRSTRRDDATTKPSTRSRAPAAERTERPERTEREVVLAPHAAPPEKTIKSLPVQPEHVELLREVGCLFVERGRVAVSMLQRQYGMDFDRACEVLDELQTLGLIGPYLGGQRRDILLTREQWLEKVGSV
jgi:hypothetical protein